MTGLAGGHKRGYCKASSFRGEFFFHRQIFMGVKFSHIFTYMLLAGVDYWGNIFVDRG